MALQFQLMQIPFSDGLQQTTDTRARLSPALDIAKDVQFDKEQGLQLRYPYVLLGNSIFGGGTLSGFRKYVQNGSELLCFTSDTLYSWNAQLSVWVSKGTHLAIKTDEVTRFATTGDQVDCDRAELNGAIVYAWTEGGAGYCAAIDKTTGNVLTVPTRVAATVAGSSTITRTRLVALSTKILLFYSVGAGSPELQVRAIDPASPAAGISGAGTVVLATGTFNLHYDVTQIIGSDAAIAVTRRLTTTSYTIHKITSALAVTSSTKARTADFGIGVSVTPDGVSAQVVRASGTNIQGDLITISTLADVFTAQAIGTTHANSTTQIACAHRSVKNAGQYRCYVFWDDTGATLQANQTNWVDDGNNLGVQAAFIAKSELASRAFDYNGSVYVHVVFDAANGGGFVVGSRLQNTYFLFRDDKTLAAKACAGTASDSANVTGNSAAHLPGIALTSGSTGYSWCGGNRRIIPLTTGSSGFAQRAPRDITISFDDNAARRTAKIGNTLYIAGSIVMAYDGVQLVDLGFAVTPYFTTMTIGGGAGALSAGGYAAKCSYRWDNAVGEIDRSTTFNVPTATAGANDTMTLSLISELDITRKTSPAAAVECWRTQVNPLQGAPFFIVSSKDPTKSSNPNRYLVNTPGTVIPTFTDPLADTAIAANETFYENGATLPHIAPASASLILATSTRMFLAGIAGQPDTVWYSRYRQDGEVATFNDALTITVPRDGGNITGLAMLNETLVVFRQYAIYALPGDGYDNLGGGQNYGPAKLIATDIGAVNQESIAIMPQGLIFKSSKGWHILDKGWSVNFIPKQPLNYIAEVPVAINVVSTQQQVRMLSSSRMLVFDWRVAEWAEWTITGGLDACIWNGMHMMMDAAGPKQQSTSYATVDYGMDVETAWIKPVDLQGFARVRKYQVLGEYRSSFHMRVRFAYNYQYDGAGNAVYTDDSYWTPYPTTVGSSIHVQFSPSIQQIASVKVRLTACSPAEDGSPSTGGEAMFLTGIGLEVGLKQGLYKLLSAAQRR